jgi:hypothetical protein
MSSPSNNDVAKVDPDPKLDSLIGREGCIALRDASLDLEGATHRLHSARELDQQAIAGGLDDPTVVLADLGIDEGAAMRHQPCERSLLVGAHQPRVAGDISGEDRRQAADDWHFEALHGGSRC